MTCRNLAIVLCLVTGMLVCGKVMGQTGQTSQDVDRSQIFRSEPSIRPGEPISQGSNAFGYAAPSANDADLGVQAILKRQEQYQPFNFPAKLRLQSIDDGRVRRVLCQSLNYCQRRHAFSFRTGNAIEPWVAGQCQHCG